MISRLKEEQKNRWTGNNSTSQQLKQHCKKKNQCTHPMHHAMRNAMYHAWETIGKHPG